MANPTNFTEISFSNIKNQIQTYLQQEYAKSNILYSPASPYGQVLFVIENLFQLSLLYLKNSIKQFDMSDASANNVRTIRNSAVTAGHIPGRSISATGALVLTVKTSIDITSVIPGGRITLFNKQTLKNKTNGLKYSLNLGIDKQPYKIDSNTKIYLNLIQGEWNTTTTFTGTGDINQTFQVTARSNSQDIENFNYNIIVDGVYWTTKKHIYDLLPNEKACVVRTGYNGGIDVIFGNGGFGAMPNAGANIQINYLVTDGSIGNIFRRTMNDWIFMDLAIDGFGNTIDITKIFDIAIYNDINFGADMESIQFTKNILPISSNNFVLGLPEQYAYAIKKLGIFSYVTAYEQYGSIYIVVTPNIVLFKNQNSDYFSIPLAAFQLDSYEISKIDTYLKAGGNIMLSKRYTITSPVISQYVINIYAIIYSDAQQDAVTAQILDAISNYFLDFSKIGRIPTSDIIAPLAAISDIDSVDVNFVSKKNEDYHIANRAKIANMQASASGKFQPSSNVLVSRSNNIRQSIISSPQSVNFTTKAQAMIGYAESQVIGIDPVLGDILFEPNEIPICRGGWYDRNHNYYSDDINNSGLKSVNIFYQGTVNSSQRPSI